MRAKAMATSHIEPWFGFGKTHWGGRDSHGHRCAMFEEPEVTASDICRKRFDERVTKSKTWLRAGVSRVLLTEIHGHIVVDQALSELDGAVTLQ